MTKETLEALETIFDTLDDYLGDTDPYFDDDWTDDDIRYYYPVFWAARELDKIVKEARKGQ